MYLYVLLPSVIAGLLEELPLIPLNLSVALKVKVGAPELLLYHPLYTGFLLRLASLQLGADLSILNCFSLLVVQFPALSHAI